MEVLLDVSKQSTNALKQFIYVDCWDTLEAIKKQVPNGLDKWTFEENQKYTMFTLRVVFKSCCYEGLKRINSDEVKEFQAYFKRGLKELAGK